MSMCENDQIDRRGFRSNVGMIIINKEGKVFWAKRNKSKFWQFPQGGMEKGETPEEAMWRELKEEVNLTANDVKILGQTKGWLSYKIPKNLLRKKKAGKKLCIGQKQKWFLLQLTRDVKIDFDQVETKEFDEYKFVSYWYPIRYIVNFKRRVYRQALTQLFTYTKNI